MPDDQRLDGWKAIANFLGRERTTAIRWANERGLPVHRVPGGRTGTVYALRAELDAWLSSDRRVATDLAISTGSAAPTDPLVVADNSARAPPPKTRPLTSRTLLAALAVVALLIVTFGRWPSSRTPPVSIAALASPAASRETHDFARSLNADLARFANASPDLAIFDSEPGTGPKSQYTVRTEVEHANGRVTANVRLVAAQGQVIWSRRFEQSGPALSTLREQVAANLIDVLRCSFGGLGAERSKVRPADLEQLMAICQSFELNDLNAAEARAGQLTATAPDLSLGWALLAMIDGEMSGQGNLAAHAQALKSSRIAARIAPDGLNTWLARIAASVGGPTSPEALPIVNEALRRHPNEPWLLYDRSIILFNLGYVQESVGDALSAVRNDPSSFGARDTAVRRLAAAGRIDEARQLQAENEGLWPGHPQVIANRARIEQSVSARHNADVTAIKDYEREFLTSPHVAYVLARLYERAGNRQAALAWLTHAPVNNPLQQWSVLFWPDMAALRTEPAFFRKMVELGLVRWWTARRKWPDFCAAPGLKYECASGAWKLSSARSAIQ